MLENIARIDDTLFNTICFKLFRGVAGVCNTDTPSQDEALKKQFAQDKEKSISNLLLYLAQNINSQNTRAWKFGSPGVEYVSLSAFQYLANNEKSDEKVLLCLSKYLAGNYYKNLVEALENETASTGRSLSNLLGLFGCREFMLESLRKYPSNSNDGNYDSIELNDRAFNDFILNQMQMAKTPILENPNCTDAVRESLKLVKSASKINMITKLANKYYGSLA